VRITQRFFAQFPKSLIVLGMGIIPKYLLSFSYLKNMNKQQAFAKNLQMQKKREIQ
jgi:hypothetical protein